MSFNLKSKSLLSLRDYTPYEIQYLLDLSIDLKAQKRAGIFPKRLANKSIALIFEKSSTRTRSAFAVAAADEGAHPEFLGINDIQLGKKESVKDTARVLGRMFDGIEFRGFKQETVEVLAEYSGVPVWNGLTDLYHPTQVLADLMTMQENFGQLKGKKVTYVGDGRNNMANSLMVGCAKMGVNYTIGAPENQWPEKKLIDYAQNIAKENRSMIEFSANPYEAVKNANVIYTDVWISMGEEGKQGIEERIRALKPFQVNIEFMKATGLDDTIFMHCLPAHHTNGIHDMEVTEDVFESKASKVFDEAENRLHTIKAVMIATLVG